MKTKISKLSNIFFTFFGILIVLGISAIFLFPKNINLLFFDIDQIKIVSIILNTIGIISLKLITNYIDKIDYSQISFDKKIELFKTKMISALVIIYLLEGINILAYILTKDNIIIPIYFLISLLLLVFIPNEKNIDKLGS